MNGWMRERTFKDRIVSLRFERKEKGERERERMGITSGLEEVVQIGQVRSLQRDSRAFRVARVSRYSRGRKFL